VALTLKSSLLTGKGKSSGSWITIYVLSTGEAELGVSDTTVWALSLKFKVISTLTDTLLIFIEGISVFPASKMLNVLVKQTNLIFVENWGMHFVF